MKFNFISAVLVCAASSAFAKVEIQGHRGARWVKPENSLPAFQYALEVGVDTLELDMLITKDKKVVVAHDPTLNVDICVDKNGKKIAPGIAIYSLTLEELKAYECGAMQNPRFKEQQVIAGTKIPTLDEVFDLVEKSPLPLAKKVLFNIETKSEIERPEFAPQPEEFVKLVAEVVNRRKWMKRTTLQSFDYRTLQAAKKLYPKWTLSALVEDRPEGKEALIQLVKKNQVQVLSPQYTWLTEQDVKDMHKLKVKVIPWTVNDLAAGEQLMKIGVDGIISDNPLIFINALKK